MRALLIVLRRLQVLHERVGDWVEGHGWTPRKTNERQTEPGALNMMAIDSEDFPFNDFSGIFAVLVSFRGCLCIYVSMYLELF